jgi:hypothetical protein
MHYKWPPVGTKLPPAENRLPIPLNPNLQDEVLAYQQAVAQQEALNQTSQLNDYYIEHTFHDWLINYQAGRLMGPSGLVGDPDAVPPQPPNGVMAVVVDNVNDTGMMGFDLQQVGPPVAIVPPYDKIPPPGGGLGMGGFQH